MKIKPVAVLILFFAGLSGQAFAGPVIDTVRCKTDPGLSYALYIPVRGNKEQLPIVYFFDPHGSGSLPLNKYKTLADHYGFILIGSNDSKNGNDWGITDRIWKSIWADTKTRLKINAARVYTCGFSGGAKVASYVAIQYPDIKGVIVGGAGLPDGVSAGDFPFSFTELVGQGDMNMTDLMQLNQEMDKTRTRHRLLLFDGKHEWAPEKIMNTAFAGLQLDAMAGGSHPKEQGFIQQYVAESKQKAAVLTQSGHLIKAMHEYQLSAHMLDGLGADAAWFNGQAAALSKNAEYRKQQQAEAALLDRESAIKAQYMQQFQQGDMHYWTTTINDLRTHSGAATAEGGMYQRLLAYLSLAFYSISNHLIAGNNEGAGHFVELYKLADPTNSEAWYFSALLHAKAGERQAVESDLLTAVKNGFTDQQRLDQEAAFKKILSRDDYSRIESAIHKH